MKLKKAIEILNAYQADLCYDPDIDLVTAIKLGIEAMKAVAEFRQKHLERVVALLPGETEE